MVPDSGATTTAVTKSVPDPETFVQVMEYVREPTPMLINALEPETS